MAQPNIHFRAYYNGALSDIDVLHMESKYAVMISGRFAAEVAHNDDWEQVSGEQLSEELLETIYDKIIDFYE